VKAPPSSLTRLDAMRLIFDKCGRGGVYQLQRLILQRGRDKLTVDRSKKQAHNMNDPCGARCPDMAKVP
jgi:hypothetical protein